MTAEEIELRYNMSKKTDEELLMIVSVNSSDYRREALNIAGEELTRRGIPFTSASEIESGFKLRSELQGVGGWLLFLCIRLTIFAPISFALSVMVALSNEAVMRQYSAAFTMMPIAMTIIVVLLGSIYWAPIIFGMYAGFALWTVRKHAVRLAKIATGLFIGLNLLEIVLTLLTPANIWQPEQKVANIFWNVSLLSGNVLWYMYLNMSKRVKNTYGKRS